MPAWKVALGFSVKESFDSNVFLQDTPPSPTCVGAARPREASLVSTIAGSLGGNGLLGPDLAMSLSYTPEASVYHSAPSENNVVHRGVVNLSGVSVANPWRLQTAVTWIDGSKEGPIYGGPGGVPAVGGIPVRDRRAALILRSAFNLTHFFGRCFIRPIGTAYVHNFFTRQRHTAGYENYIDRQEWIGGVDLGYEVRPKTRLIAGFRYGRQDQLKLLGIDSPYDSCLRRFLAGVEGSPTRWLQLNLLAGPETRSFATGTPKEFDRERTLLWIDTSAIVTPGPADACTLTARRFEQPAFSSQSIYEDITYEINWRHKFTKRFSAVAGYKAYNGNWQSPVNRDDWILTPCLLLQFTPNGHACIELAYALDSAVSHVPFTVGREYRRQLSSVSARYSF